MSKVLAYLNEQDGASAAEYALILAIVGAAIAGAAIFLGAQIASAINSAATCISSHGTAGC
jgi:pilus assembly protein Flp/PilA